ncbi:hypothetical protein NQ314_005322 [Rhamnusium bicolor]|uniref:Uncharacterized protein n=1 Tax=Rhamnusium bicolor TaxID=1586634 RepID=A0AAV8ZHQ2_9CUCU|nr:hypothetical protein NQ314_005322 [Rhamnusium bicolor]
MLSGLGLTDRKQYAYLHPKAKDLAHFEYDRKDKVVVTDLVLLKLEQCPICIEMRAAALQSVLGCVMPLILAQVSAIGVSTE